MCTPSGLIELVPVIYILDVLILLGSGFLIVLPLGCGIRYNISPIVGANEIFM